MRAGQRAVFDDRHALGVAHERSGSGPGLQHLAMSTVRSGSGASAAKARRSRRAPRREPATAARRQGEREGRSPRRALRRVDTEDVETLRANCPNGRRAASAMANQSSVSEGTAAARLARRGADMLVRGRADRPSRALRRRIDGGRGRWNIGDSAIRASWFGADDGHDDVRRQRQFRQGRHRRSPRSAG